MDTAHSTHVIKLLERIAVAFEKNNELLRERQYTNITLQPGNWWVNQVGDVLSIQGSAENKWTDANSNVR